MFALKVKVLGAEDVYATNDFCTADFEIRHFIDKNYLASLPGGQNYLDSIVEPTPPCAQLWGTKDEDGNAVVGMLSSRLKVSINVGQDEWVMTKLQNVLVIESLPVPIHISLKALQLHPSSEVQSSGMVQKEAFPESFHGHPYWNNDDYHVMGSYAHMMPEASSALTGRIIEGRTGRPNKVKTKSCQKCGKINCNRYCSRCQRTYYCTEECQRRDWRRHRDTCIQTDDNN
jgi:hypothetical protein